MRTASLSLVALLLLTLASLWVLQSTGRAADPASAPPASPAPAPGAQPVAAADLPATARRATSTDPVQAAAAIAALRATGPAGLAALQTEYADALKRPIPGGEYEIAVCGIKDLASEAAAWNRLRLALDQVGGQYDDHATGLFWYTDFAAAQKAAAAQHKPILTLRMLGKLTDEYSCANSRFFRAVLYTDPLVQKKLRDEFILHWESVRPVPVVTIDMGDGRTIKRTITGNSIHYVLDEQGRVVDAIPGLYGPQAFYTMLDQAGDVARQAAVLDDHSRQTLLSVYHATALTQTIDGYFAEAARVKLSAAPADPWAILKQPGVTFTLSPAIPGQARELSVNLPAEPPPATTAALLALPKFMAERPIINAVAPAAAAPATAETMLEDALPTAAEAAPLAGGKSAMEAPIVDAISPQPFKPAAGKIRPAISQPPATALFLPVFMDVEAALAAQFSSDFCEAHWLGLIDEQRLAALTQFAVAEDGRWARFAPAHADECRLSSETLAYMRACQPCQTHEPATAAATEKTANTAMNSSTRFDAMVAKFREALAEDTVRNEYRFHTQIRDWLRTAASEGRDLDLKILNEKVYAGLFLTPSSDPWLGLVPPDTFSALKHDGLMK